MLKFLRRYNKFILVIGGSLLMIAFLVPSAIKEMGNAAANKTFLRMDGRKVSRKEFDFSQREYQALERAPLGKMILQMHGINEGAEHWLLLTTVAERNGFVGGVQEGRAALPEIQGALGQQLARVQLNQKYPGMLDQIMNNPQLRQITGVDKTIQESIDYVKQSFERELPRVLHDTQMTEDQFDLALAKLRGADRLQGSYLRAAKVSGPRVLLEAKKQLERATVDYIFLPPDRVMADVGEPDAAALQAHLERFKAMKPGEGEMGIGYLLPPRVKLEWMTINRPAIEAQVHPDLVAVRKAFAQGNPGGSASEKFEEAKDRLTRQLRNETVDKVLREADQTIRSAVSLATRKLSDDGIFKVLPPDFGAARPDLGKLSDQITARVKEKTGITIEKPVVMVKTDQWLTGTDLRALPGIGQGSLVRGQQRTPFATYALSVHELSPASQISLQVGLPSPEPVQDSVGSISYFTILETRPESAPTGVEDAKQVLTLDWKKIQAFERLKRDADGFGQQAIAQGLDSLDPKKDEPVEAGKPKPPGAVHKGASVTRPRMNPSDPDADFDTFRSAVLDAASALDPTVPADTVDISQRTLVVPVPRKQGLAVVRILTYWPVTQEMFRQQEPGLANSCQVSEVREVKDNPFSLARLKERLHVRVTGGKSEPVDRVEPPDVGD